MKLRTVLSLCLILALLPVSTFADDCQGMTYGAESPQALIDGVQDAARNADMGALSQYLTKSDRAKAGLGLTIGATMMLAMQEMGMGMGQGADGDAEAMKADLAANQERLQGILNQYGVEQPDQATLQRIMQQGPDAMSQLESTMDDVCTPNLIADLATFLSETTNQKVTDQLKNLTGDDVGPIEIDGDTATSTVGGDPIRMNKIDGRWYVDIESTSGSAPGPG